MSYYFTKELNVSFDDAIAKVTEELKKEGFGILTEIDVRATMKKNTNVLQHLMGYFKKQLSADEKQELLEVIDHYYQGHFPLIVPITLINHYVRKYGQPYLQIQYYLNPHPLELQLRNFVWPQETVTKFA